MFLFACICLVFTQTVFGSGKTAGLQLPEIVQEDSPATVAIFHWAHDENNQITLNGTGVIGTGFLVGRDGYFITANHIVETFKASELAVDIRDQADNSSGIHFDVIERDKDHDLALCKLQISRLFKKKDLKSPPDRPESSFHPATSLKVASSMPIQGDEIAIMGYPLGSILTPVIQSGNIGATNAMLLAVRNPAESKGGRLIISVSGNHGNSGGPVISRTTGEVLGMISQYVPTPLLESDGKTLSGPDGNPINMQSGLLVAVPAKWIMEIMQRHGVDNSPVRLREDLFWF